MCRFAGYMGPDAPLSTLLTDPPHGLFEQAHSPRLQTYGKINVDGTGVAWWRDGDPHPLRYVYAGAPWADPNLPVLAPRLTGVLQIAAVRSATAGIPFGAGNVHPFLVPASEGRPGLAAAHNGFLRGFRGPVGRDLVCDLPENLYAQLDAVSDSQALLLTIEKHRRQADDDDLAQAVSAGIAEAKQVCARYGQAATLNLIVADGRSLVATRTALSTRTNSLWVARHPRRWPDAIVVASEPLDDDSTWYEVQEDRLVRIQDDEVEFRSLAGSARVTTAH